MRKEVEQLALMGAMPDEADERITAALVDEYADLLGKIVKPVTLDEAHILIKLFPPTALYGIEWTLLHLIESVYSEIKSLEYRELINECNSTEFKKMLVQRLNNSQQKKVINEAGYPLQRSPLSHYQSSKTNKCMQKYDQNNVYTP